MSETPEMTEQRLTEEKELHSQGTAQPESAIQTIKISNTHRKLLERLQPNRIGRVKIIQKPKTELIPIWERRGQTEDQYFKRSK